MPADDGLILRVRGTLAAREITERRMFGGAAFMVAGNVACCVTASGLLVRFDADQTETLLAKPHARPFVMQGRAQRGWLLVDDAGLATPYDLRKWVEVGVTFASSLPPRA